MSVGRPRSIASLATYVNGYPFKPAELSYVGVPVLRIRQLLDPTADFDFYGGQDARVPMVASGDLIFSWSATLACRIWGGGHAALNQHLFRCDPAPDVDRRWLFWALTASLEAFRPFMHGSAMTHVTRPMLKAVKVETSSPAAQRVIADFLDRECARVAEATTAAARTVRVLAQQEREVFERLTLGAPTVALRRRLLRIEQGWSPECEATTAEPGEWGVLKVGCVNHGRFRAGEHKRLPDDLTPRPALEIWPGDLLMSRANTRELVGSAAVVDDVDGRRLMLCDKTFRLITRDDTTPAFLSLALGSRSVRDQIEVDTAGASSSMQNIAQSTIRGLLIPDLPLAEQESIERAVAARAAILAEATHGLTELQDHLAEYRDALITEAVTGQLDVTAVSDAQMDERLHQRADAVSA